MNRRNLIALLGGTSFIGGCVGVNADEDSPKSNRTQNTNRYNQSKENVSKSMNINRIVTVDDVQSTSSINGLTFDVSIIEKKITPEHTSQIEISARNNAKKSLSITPFPEAVLSANYGKKGIGLKESEQIPAPQCSKTSHATGIAGVGKPSINLKPNEESHTKYIIYNDKSSDKCMKTGLYPFKFQFSKTGENESSGPISKLSFTIDIRQSDNK